MREASSIISSPSMTAPRCSVEEMIDEASRKMALALVAKGGAGRRETGRQISDKLSI